MLKKLMLTTAIGGLMIGSALAAENNAMSPAPVNPPAAASTTGSSSAKFVNSQRQDQYLASKFKGTDVIGTDDKKIGDVSDILFDKDGKIVWLDIEYTRITRRQLQEAILFLLQAAKAPAG